MPTTTSKISVIAKQLRDAAEILAKIADSCDTLIVASESNGTHASVKSRIVSTARGKRGTKGLSRASTKGLTGKRLFPTIKERPETRGRRSKAADKSLSVVLKTPGREWD